MSVITKLPTTLALAALISTGCSNSKAQDVDSGPRGANGALTSADRAFVDNAVAAERREVEHAKLAHEQASSPAVKEYAAHLLTAHVAADQQLAEIIARKGSVLSEPVGDRDKRGSIGAKGDATTATKAGGRPSGSASPTGTTGASGTVATTGEALDRERAGMTDPWMHKTGAAFDEGFVAAQIKAHEDAIGLFHQQSTIGVDPDLKAFAAQQLPALREHLQQAQDLRRTMRQSP